MQRREMDIDEPLHVNLYWNSFPQLHRVATKGENGGSSGLKASFVSDPAPQRNARQRAAPHVDASHRRAAPSKLDTLNKLSWKRHTRSGTVGRKQHNMPQKSRHRWSLHRMPQHAASWRDPNPNPNRASYVQIPRVLDAVTGVLSFRFRSKQVSIGVDPLTDITVPKPIISANVQISKFVLINCILLLDPTQITARVRAPGGGGLWINAPASHHKIMFYIRSYAKNKDAWGGFEWQH